MISTLLIGGKGTIGAGLRTYLPQLDAEYRVVSADLPGAPDAATDATAHRDFIELDASVDDAKLRSVLEGRDLVVYLARIDPLSDMNAMTDQVFKAIMDVCPNAVVIGSSSVHATGAAYYGYTREDNSPIANRRFDEVVPWPEPLSVMTEPCPTGDYGVEKAYVEAWCHRLGAQGQSAVAARWGGINPTNGKKDEISYFTVWCHQEDSARFVDACYKTARAGKLRPSAHYYVISDNTYNVFDIETTRREIGYEPQHDAESLYGDGDGSISLRVD
ncbi:MAG: NAD(P)-dependent oxidoreductase [Chloroflexi bacterium]|nr:NAD(P)-dependent oxidoreductase [Chloroflexota bacterium]